MGDIRIFRAIEDYLNLLGISGGALKIDSAKVGNVDGGEDDLIAFTLPANTLDANNKGIRITAWGGKANNANAKTIKLFFGSKLLLTLSLVASETEPWRFKADIIRTAASAQKFIVQVEEFNFATGFLNPEMDIGTATEDDTAGIVIKCTGTGVASDDIEQEGLIVEKIGS